MLLQHLLRDRVAVAHQCNAARNIFRVRAGVDDHLVVRAVAASGCRCRYGRYDLIVRVGEAGHDIRQAHLFAGDVVE